MSGTEAVEPVIARLGMMLEFQFCDPYWIPSFSDDFENPCSPITVVGPISRRRVRLIVRGNVSALAVIFEPSGFYQLFGVPASPLAERGTEGQAVLGTGVSKLYERLGNSTFFLQRVRLLDDFFLSRLQRSTSRPSLLHEFRAFLEAGARSTVAQVSRGAGVSARQLERKSLEYFGVSPTMLTRISRFQRALALRTGESTSWLQVAHASEYYDQMHMIRDFHTFAGGPPGESFAGIAAHHLINFQ
ncbi:MAG: AraC family transcriptional regulator [Ignavibacteriota bacterium]